MKYWVTSHWPPGRDEIAPEVKGVYLKEENRSAGDGVSRGDQIFVYQLKTGPPIIRSSGEKVRRIEGRMGIVALLEATSESELYGGRPSDYVDHWKWYVETKLVSKHGYISQPVCNEIIGFANNYNWFGFGRSAGSGLREIEKSEFDQLLQHFNDGNNI